MNNKKTLSDYPHLVDQLHPTKNGYVDPFKVPHRSKVKFWWLCSKGIDHEWEASIGHRTKENRATGCSICRGLKIVSSNSLASLRPDIANSWNYDKNKGIGPNEVAASSSKKFWWICDKNPNHTWIASVNNRNNGRGCSVCRGFTIIPETSLLGVFPNIAISWHPRKNEFSPSEVAPYSTKVVWWICERNHEWTSTVYTRSKGHGCPYCCESKGETLIDTYLKDHRVEFQREFRFSDCRHVYSLPFDFAILSSKKPIALIEFHGIQHFKSIDFFGGKEAFEKRKEKDRIKKMYCENKGLPLLEIPYNRISLTSQILDEFRSWCSYSFNLW